MAFLSILQPKAKHKRKNAMPASFFAVGLVKGKDVRSVRAVLTTNPASNESGTSEVQTITAADGPNGGQFSLSFIFSAAAPANQTTTTALNHNATPAQIQAALRAVPTIGGPHVTCTGGGPVHQNPVTVTFQNDLASLDVPKLQFNNISLVGTGANPRYDIDTATPGVSKAKLVRFEAQPIAGKPGKHRYFWVFHLNAVTTSVTPVNLTLKVIALDANGVAVDPADDQVQFQAVDKPPGGGAPGPPVITYPEREYELEGGERQYFFPFGLSEVPVAEAVVGGAGALFIGYDPPTSMWYAVFPDLTEKPGPGDYDFSVSNGTAVSQGIGIADH
jgi:hypothetical protein